MPVEMREVVEQSGTVIPGGSVRWTAESARVGSPGQCTPEPRVELIREANIIRGIEVICACGKRIRLRCVYPD